MKRYYYFLLVMSACLFADLQTFAQVNTSYGINMPGNWDNPIWTNPPNIAALKSAVQGGEIVKIDLGQDIYQAIFQAGTGGDVAAGSFQFKFSNGSTGAPWTNNWGSGSFAVNTITNVSYNLDPNNSVTLTNGKWYVVNFEDKGYVNTRAIFMELSEQPASIASVQQVPVLPAANESVTVSVTLSDTKCAEELVYLRYTTNNWVSSNLVLCNFSGTTGTATIPGVATDTEVDYYVFSTTISNPSSDYDIRSIRVNNNSGLNFSYTAGETSSCTASDYSVMTTQPAFPQADTGAKIVFNASLGNAGLSGYVGDVYVHIGVITNLSANDTDWKYVKTDWGENTPETKMTSLGGDLYELNIANIRTYFGVPAAQQILKIAILARSGEPVDVVEDPNNFYLGKNEDGSDIYLNVYQNVLAAKFIAPAVNQVLFNSGDVVSVCAEALLSDNISLYIDETLLMTLSGTVLSYPLATASYSAGSHTLRVVAENGGTTVESEHDIFIRGAVQSLPLPSGIDKPGIHYISTTEVTLVLHDPSADKNYAFVIGDFNNWIPDEQSYMKRTPDGQYFWTTISGLTPGTEYAYQYLIDGNLKIADPYTEKVLDPWNDKWIPAYNYPNLKAYPTGKTTGIVSVLQTNQTSFNWQYSEGFIPQAQGSTHKNVMIYELHIRDFVSSQAIKDVTAKLDYLQKLGINVIELMPINEFEGNDSWGYNPSFYFAPDKAYGTETDYKNFVDQCHKRGIAVVIDMVFNHSFRMSPFVLMYYDEANDKPTADNPWYNEYSPNPDYSWGYDFNHTSTHTRNLVKRTCEYWLTEYKVDGFRFDFTKGFTNTPGNGWNYDYPRIEILQDYYNHIQWVYNRDVSRFAYVILEHLTDNSEEIELSNRGMLLWTGQALNEDYGQANMGFKIGSDFSNAYYVNRGWANANLVQYMESHDEERMMYKNMTFGDYTHDVPTAIKHAKAVAPFFMLIPGPKMIWQFQELGYDISIDNPCRVCPKPIHWEYYNNADRYSLYETYSRTAKLIAESGIFENSSTDFSMDIDEGGHDKHIWLSNNGVKMVLASNISGDLSFNITPYFHHTGTWYDFFTGETLNVTSTDQQVWFEPGDMHLWINQDFSYVATENPTLKPEVELFPNPAHQFLNIKSQTDYLIEVTDISGKVVMTQSIGSGQSQIEISQLQSGMYIVNFIGKTTRFSKQIMKM